MKTTTIEPKQKLLKRFHTLCTKARIEAEEKSAIVYSFGVDSSSDLTMKQLAEACKAVEKFCPQEQVSMDMLRKRLIAAIGGWLTLTSQGNGIELIKGVACRASKRDYFNEIPREQLNNLYHSFRKAQKDFKSVEGIHKDNLKTLKYLN
jgi:hypothetical protein